MRCLLTISLFFIAHLSQVEAQCAPIDNIGTITGCGCAESADICPNSNLPEFVLCTQAYQIGLVRRTSPIQLLNGFLGPFQVRFGTDADASDQIAIFMSPDSNGLGACNNLSYQSTSEYLSDLSAYVAICFDNKPGADDLVSLVTFRNGQKNICCTNTALISGANVEDGGCHPITVMYNGYDNTLIVLIDGDIRISYCLNIFDLFDGQTSAYVGIVANNGALPGEPGIALSTSQFDVSYICCPTVLGCISGSKFNDGWYPIGPFDESRWKVESLGTIVKSDNDSKAPSIFVLPIDLIDVEINFKMTVDAAENDDDCIGMVWGLQQPGCGNQDEYDSYLFSWRKENDSTNLWLGNEGYVIAKVKGHIPVGAGVDSTDYYFWGNPQDAVFQHLETNQGPGLGWKEGDTYAIRLFYTSCRTIILLNGDTIFNQAGAFEPGRFGFYTYSQKNVVFKDFSYKLLPNFLSETKDICVGQPVTFHWADFCGQPQKPGSLDSIRWDIGAWSTGNIYADSAALSPTFVFTNPGLTEVVATVSNAYSCNTTLSKTFNVLSSPMPSLDDDTTICLGSVLYFDVTVQPWPDPLSYFWYSETDTFVGPSFVISEPGSYWVEINNGRCAFRDTISVGFFPELKAAVVVESSCFEQDNGAVIATASAGMPPYVFSLNGQLAKNGDFHQLPPGYYQLVISDGNGCTFGATAIQVGEYLNPTVLKNVQDAFCFGASDGALHLISSDPSLRFSLDASGTFLPDTVFGGLSAGNYSLYLQDVPGCVYPHAFSVEEPPGRFLEILSRDTIDFGESLVLTPDITPLDSLPFTYNWYGTRLHCDSCAITSADPWASTIYHLTLTDARGCTTTASKKVIVLVQKAIYVPNIFSPNNDGRHDILYTLGTPRVKRITAFRIFDRWGALMFEAHDFIPDGLTNGWNGTCNGRSLNPAVFAYTIEYITVDGQRGKQEGDITVLK